MHVSALPTVVVSQLGRSDDYFSKQLLLSPVTTFSILHSKCSEYLFYVNALKKGGINIDTGRHSWGAWSTGMITKQPAQLTICQYWCPKTSPHLYGFFFLLHVDHSRNYISTFLSHCLYFSMKVVPTLTTPQHFKDHYAGKMARWVRTLPQKLIPEFGYPTPT